MTKPTIKEISKEISRLEDHYKNCKDPLEERVCYTVAEILRWSILNTAGWEKPLENTLSNIKILKDELKRHK